MSFTCASRPLIECRLILPEAGAYRGRVEVAGETAISGQVDLELPGTTLKCTVSRGGVSDTRVNAVLSAGVGTLSTPVPGQSFFEETPRNILKHTVGTEKVNAILHPLADQPIARWVRVAGPADAAVSLLAKYLKLAWWFEPDGSIKIDEIKYPSSSVVIDVLPHDNPEYGRLEFASEEATVLPRTTVTTDYGSYRVTEVRYRLAEGIWRGTLHYA